MKRVFTILICLAMMQTGSYAQSFFKGSNVISAGIGLGGSLGSFSYGSQSPAISVQYERGVWEIGGPGVISLGGYAGIKSYTFSGQAGDFRYSQKWNYTVIGIRSAYHYNGINNDKFDVYGGLMLSYNLLSYKYEDNGGGTVINSGSYGSTAGITAYVGGRYNFINNLALFAELGYGVSYLTIGLALQL